MQRWKTAVISIVIIVGLFAAMDAIRSSRQRKHDAHIVGKVHDAMEQQLAGLRPDHPITLRYGKFQSWERGEWNRPRYLGMLVSRLEALGIAHFEKADVDVKLIISRGPVVGVSLRDPPPFDADAMTWSRFWDLLGASHPDFEGI